MGGGTILHYDGRSWHTAVSGFRCELVDVKGTAADRVLALCSCGDVLYYDGKDWTKNRREWQFNVRISFSSAY